MVGERAAYRKVLLVAPDDEGLAVLPEIDGVTRLGFVVTPLQGKVTDTRLFEYVAAGDYDVFHWAGHGDGDGFQMSDGVWLNCDAIGQAVGQSGARLANFNVCQSAAIAQRLVNNGLPAAIGTFVDVPDNVAKLTGMTFYQRLAKSQDAHEAYRLSCPDTYYGWFANGAYQDMLTGPVLDELKALRAGIGENQADRQSLRAEVRRLVWLVGGSAAMAAGSCAMLGLHVWVAR